MQGKESCFSTLQSPKDSKMHCLNPIQLCPLRPFQAPAPREPLSRLSRAMFVLEHSGNRFPSYIFKRVRAKAPSFPSNLCIQTWNLIPQVLPASPKHPCLCRLFKVQEVSTQGVRGPASAEAPHLRLASPSSWVCPPAWEGQ